MGGLRLTNDNRLYRIRQINLKRFIVLNPFFIVATTARRLILSGSIYRV